VREKIKYVPRMMVYKVQEIFQLGRYLGLQKDIQLETSCQITKTKQKKNKKTQCFTYLESAYVTWIMSYMLSCDQLQNSNPCVEVWYNESFHLFFSENLEIM
jgi:hypothetical protein